jgi:undecaprenyl pyrophosphate phosphatase UppP
VAVIALLADLLRMLRAALDGGATGRARPSPRRAAPYIVVGTIPVGIAGVLLKPPSDRCRGRCRSSPPRRSWSRWAWPRRAQRAPHARLRRHPPARRQDHRRRSDAGAGPGVSRSGHHAARGDGARPAARAAARASLLLSVPAVGGRGHLRAAQGPARARRERAGAAHRPRRGAISGYAAIAWLLRFLRTRTTMPFVVYRIALGILIFALLALHRIG